MKSAWATKRVWKDYWAHKNRPLHARETEEHYREQAAELRSLFLDHSLNRVLEIGCGNGALFPHLGFAQSDRYMGIDFSPSMLQDFRSRFPEAQLALADGEQYCSDDEFDLIFSNQVVQYWTKDQLTEHLDSATKMLASDGRIVLAGIPWSRMRLAYARGDMTGGARCSSARTALSFIDELVFKRIGTWYDFPDIVELAEPRGFRAKFTGCAYYPYRFHAVLRPFPG